MELVVDANILFAALIKDSTTRRILLLRTPFPLTLYTTPFIMDEFLKYQSYLARKAGAGKGELMEILVELFTTANINIISENELKPYLSKALKISPDRNDVQYFAAALAKNCAIWSNERKLKKQSEIQVVNTADLLSVLGEN